MLQQTLEKIHNSLLPYGLYLQKRESISQLSIAETHGQHFNFEPLLWAVAVFVVAEFVKGFLGKLGSDLASYLTNGKKAGKKEQELDPEVLASLLQKDIECISKQQMSEGQLAQLTEQGLKRVESYVIASGIPSYRAHNLVLAWRSDLVMLLRREAAIGTQD